MVLSVVRHYPSAKGDNLMIDQFLSIHWTQAATMLGALSGIALFVFLLRRASERHQPEPGAGARYARPGPQGVKRKA